MRNITITRRKSFVGCAMKDQVYIRDEQAPELTIDGVPCRKIGDLKNKETKAFQLDDGEQQIFLITDKLSKDYCYGTVTVPAGQEDVALSGTHKYDFAGNAFRFDGVQPTPAQQAKSSKNLRKGRVIMIGAIVLGLLAGILLSRGCSFTARVLQQKTFTTGDFQITLNDSFKSDKAEDFYAFYQSKSVMVFSLREGKSLFDDITLAEYGELVLKANNRTGVSLNREDGLLWFEYTATPENQEIYYMAFCYESDDAFWLVTFATPSTNRKQAKDNFFQWAETVKVD